MPLLKDFKPPFLLSPVVKSFIVELVATMNIWQVRGGLIFLIKKKKEKKRIEITGLWKRIFVLKLQFFHLGHVLRFNWMVTYVDFATVP